MKNKLLFSSILSTVLTITCMGGNLVASADENHYKNVDIYPQNNYSLTSVGAIQDNNLTLEETIVNSAKNFETFVDISQYGITDTQDIYDVYYKIAYTQPELFYLDIGYSYYIDTDGNIFMLQLKYTIDQNEYEEVKSEIDNKFSEITNKITDDMPDMEKVLLVHDYLCTNFKYDLSDNHNANIQSFVETGTGVCQAYALSYSYILNQLGINNTPVISTSLNHMWNMVEVDGNWYHIDITWDDYTPDLLGWSSHAFFLNTDEQVNKNHTDDWFTYTGGSATDNSYDKYTFKSSSSPYVVINSNIYCLDNGTFCEYNFNKDTLNPISNLISNDKWYNLNSQISGTYYISKYSSLNAYKDVIFYNSPKQVLVMDLNGNILDTVYTLNDDKTQIFGMTIKDNSIIIQLESNLNASRDDFSTNFVTVGNVDEIYQKIDKTPSPPTTTTSTSTPIETTIPTDTTTTTNIITTKISTDIETTTTTDTITTTQPPIITTTPTDTTTTESPKYSNNDNFIYDVNLDGNISVTDLICLKTNLLGISEKYSFFYDVNGDNVCNILDLLDLKNKIINS